MLSCIRSNKFSSMLSHDLPADNIIKHGLKKAFDNNPDDLFALLLRFELFHTYLINVYSFIIHILLNKTNFVD